MSIPQTRGRTRETDVQQQRWGDLSVESRGHWRKSRESSPDPSHERPKENRRVDFTKRDDNIIPPATERISYAAAVSRPPKPNVMSTCLRPHGREQTLFFPALYRPTTSSTTKKFSLLYLGF